ncbi:peptidoglycan amidohydrolase family protein [Methylomonas montana]|uniref:peptidoglycan amidohydrolase family protein n=1 Tax=Methylomonas montana TaxID=3058963 RepID=UPI00265B54A7|nr:peptidoglycan amidohydrolase family protein [Methylomonas montana]WKJ90615.1 peptidoglycan amidohydrolase family protein [Methylomonas montana]
MPNLEKALKFAVDIANDDSHGYNWGSEGRKGKPDYDCSSLVCTALKHGGFDIGGASYTGDMRDNLVARGWKTISESSKKRGDILLYDYYDKKTKKHKGHVAFYLDIYDGPGKYHGKKCLVQASWNEKGDNSDGTDGKPGDQNGHEIEVLKYYNYPWNYILRWTGASGSGSTTPTEPKGNATTIQVHIKGGGWLPPVNQVDDTDDGYAGSFGKPIDGLAVAGTEYRVHTAKHGWLAPVKKMDISDEDNGMAGIYGDPIDGVAIKNKTYRIHTKEHGWLPWVSKYDIKDSDNGMAGVYGHAIDGLQVR